MGCVSFRFVILSGVIDGVGFNDCIGYSGVGSL